jgi:hypothetical protein
LQTKDLTFHNAQNELVFERKKGKTNSKKWPKTHLLCEIEPELGCRKALADGGAPGGYTGFEFDVT